MAVKTMSRRQVVIDCVRAPPFGPGERDVSVIPALGRLIDPGIELCVSVTDLLVDFVASLPFRAMLKGKMIVCAHSPH